MLQSFNMRAQSTVLFREAIPGCQTVQAGIASAMNVFYKCAIVALCLLLTSCSGSKKIIQSQRVHQAIVIDGKLSDWQQPMQHYHTSTSLWYSIRNDGSNLYMCIVASDEKIQMKIVTSGLQIGLDTLGGRKNHLLVQYPAGTDLKLSVSRPATHVQERGRLLRELLTQSTMIRVSGFDNKKNEQIISLQNTKGIQVAVDWTEDGYMVYELMLPIPIVTAPATPVKVGVQMIVKGLPVREGMGPPMGYSGGQGPPAGGFPRDGSPGMPPVQAGNDSMSKDEVVRFVVQLASQK
jgi:hypothetical protein